GAGAMASRQQPRQCMCRQRAQHERREQRDVVGENRRAAEPLDGTRDERQPYPVIRERKASVSRVEAQSIPPRPDKGQLMCVPPQDPRAKQGIAEVVRHCGGEATDEVVKEQQRQRGVTQKSERKRACAAQIRHDPHAWGHDNSWPISEARLVQGKRTCRTEAETTKTRMLFERASAGSTKKPSPSGW